MSSKTPQQEEILPEQILRAALQLYQRYGLKKVTMDDVSKAIGKSRSILYYYYKNKDEIFEAVIDLLLREVSEEITRAVESAASIEEKLKAFCLAKVHTSEERKSVFRAMEAGMDAEEISRHATIMSDLHERMMRSEGNLLKGVLARGIEEGRVRPLLPREIETIIFIILSGIRGMKREMAHTGDFSKLPVTVNAFTAMVMAWLRD